MISQLKEDDPIVKAMIERLENSEYVINITQISKERRNKGGGNATLPEKSDPTVPQGATIMFDPYMHKTRHGIRPPRVGLAHELGHTDDLIQGRGILVDKEKALNGDSMELMNYMQLEEYPIQIENLIRRQLNLGLRTLNDYFNK